MKETRRGRGRTGWRSGIQVLRGMGEGAGRACAAGWDAVVFAGGLHSCLSADGVSHQIVNVDIRRRGKLTV